MNVANRAFVSLGFAVLFWLAVVPTASAQEQLWLKQFGSSERERALALASDDAGGVFVSGATDGSLGGPIAGAPDAFLAQYDKDGNQVWIRQFGTASADWPGALTPDGAGGVFVAGWTEGSLGGPNAGASDIFLARYDSAGTQTWVRQFGTVQDNWATGLASDGAGGVIVVGATDDNLGGPNAGETDAFVARYDGTGSRVWIKQFGTSEYEEATAVVPDGAGGAYIGGNVWYANLGGPNAGREDAYLAHYDAAGNRIWIRQFGTSGVDRILALAVDGNGGLFASGRSGGILGGPNSGVGDAFVSHYNAAGVRSWVRQFGTRLSTFANALAPDGDGGVIVAGSARGNLGGTNPNLGIDDVFLANYNSIGLKIWIRQFGTSSWDIALAAASDGSGGVVVAGRTGGDLGGPIAGIEDAFVARFPADADGDGLLDDWEKSGGVPYVDAGGSLRRVSLPGADWQHKDLYIEVDSRSGNQLNAAAIANIAVAFDFAPLENPDGIIGVNLHVIPDESNLAIPAVWATDGCWPLDFDTWRKDHFGTPTQRGSPDKVALLEAKAKAYRYCIIAEEADSDVGGCGGMFADDFVIYSKGFDVDDQGAAFMHELGHNLGLNHGGGDDKNGKPNYPSIMNYPLAFKYNWNSTFWQLDYSREDAGKFQSMNEQSLDETVGVGIPFGYYMNWALPIGVNEPKAGGGTIRAHRYVRLDGSTNAWPGGTVPTAAFTTDFGDIAGTGLQDGRLDSGIVQDLNYVTARPNIPGGIPNTPSAGETFDPYDDWAHVRLPLSASLGTTSATVRFPTDELTHEAIAWINASFPELPSVCYADCDQSTGIGVLDVFDFLCFQNSFVNAEPYACDCDTSTGVGVCDVFDFLCFQDAFVGGCP
jgi:Beta-propeller repeat